MIVTICLLFSFPRLHVAVQDTEQNMKKEEDQYLATKKGQSDASPEM